MTTAPFLLTGEPLRRLLQRQIERQQAGELRAWRRRNAWYRQRGTWRVLLVIGLIFILCSLPLLYAFLGL